MRLVVIESPFAGRGAWALQRWWRRLRNIRYARACVRDALLRGEAPMASHLIYTQSGILADNDPEQRTLGMNAGFSWLGVADASAVYVDLGVTDGMQTGIAKAQAIGVPVVYRKLIDWG